MEQKDITKPHLKKVAKALNQQLGLEPPILVDLKVDALKEKCVEAAGLIDPEQDVFTDEVWEILGALNCDPRVEAVGEVEEVRDSEAQEEDVQELVDEAMEDTLVEDFKAAKKLAELKELAQEWECFNNLDLDSYAGLQGPKKLRADMLECLPDDVKEQVNPAPAAAAKPAGEMQEGNGGTPAKEKKAKEKKAKAKVSRSEILAMSIREIPKEGWTKEEIVEKSRAKYEELNSTQDTGNGPAAQFDINLGLLKALGILTKEGSKFFFHSTLR